jgi:hypothetical protein
MHILLMTIRWDWLKLAADGRSVQADLRGEPKADETGKLWTPGAVDFFRIVNEQLQVTKRQGSE